jgi:hypothetical protein
MTFKVGLAASVIAIMIAFGMVGLVSQVSADNEGSDNGSLTVEWTHDFFLYYWGYFGASPAIADLGVNKIGDEPNADLEIVSGSDEQVNIFPELGVQASGIWRTFDSQGNIEWAKDTESDEARGDPCIIDLDGDGDLEIVGGTTSGETIETMNHNGNFVWTFPDPPRAGRFMWDGGIAAVNANTSVSGVEVFASNRYLHEIYCLDGDNSDGVDDGYTWPGGWPWTGVEGVDWDVLWIFTVPCEMCEIYSTVAVDDVDNDGVLEVAFGTTNGVFYVLNAVTGSLEVSFPLDGAIYASAAVGNIDIDPYREMVIGTTTGTIHALQWNGTLPTIEWTYTTGASVYSSAAIGDIDGDERYEIVVGSHDNNIYALSASGMIEWSYPTGGDIYSSPSLASRGVETGLGIYVGSEDTYLYLLDGKGDLIDRFPTSEGGYLGFMGIHTSPSIADVDGDEKLEIFFYDWGETSAHDGHTFWALEDGGSDVAPHTIGWGNFRRDHRRSGFYPFQEEIRIDIKPGGYPNCFNIDGKGSVTVAILGNYWLDVTRINVSTLMFAGLNVQVKRNGSYRCTVEDVSGDFSNPEGAPDGYPDLVCQFEDDVCRWAPDNDTATLTGELLDRTSIIGSDTICTRP